LVKMKSCGVAEIVGHLQHSASYFKVSGFKPRLRDQLF
jgi:hypothetical protein